MPARSKAQPSRDATALVGSRCNTSTAPGSDAGSGVAPSAEAKYGLRVRYRRRIRNRFGRVVWRSKWRHNLILDGGLDKFGTILLCNCFTHGVVGTGTNPVERDSGATTFTAAAGVVTASAGFFEAGDVGRLLRLDSGEQGYVTVFTSTTLVNWTGVDVGAAAEGTVYYVNRTALQTESKRTSTYALDSGDNSSTWSSALKTWTHQRTYQFSAEVGAVTYREVGWSNGSGATTLFGMDILPGAGDSLVAGQQYEIAVQLVVSFSPTAPTAAGNVGTGYSTAGDACWGSIRCNTSRTMTGIASDGTTGAGDAAEPAGTAGTSGTTRRVRAASASFTVPSIDDATISAPAGTDLSFGASAYVSGNFYRDFSATFSTSQANGTVHGFVIYAGSAGMVFGQLFTTPPTKTSSQTLSFVFRVSWQRVFA